MTELTRPGISDKTRTFFAGDCAEAALDRAEEINTALLARIEALDADRITEQTVLWHLAAAYRATERSETWFRIREAWLNETGHHHLTQTELIDEIRAHGLEVAE